MEDQNEKLFRLGNGKTGTFEEIASPAIPGGGVNMDRIHDRNVAEEEMAVGEVRAMRDGQIITRIR
jgi:hypothetical protein